jgi:hypothetical protein
MARQAVFIARARSITATAIERIVFASTPAKRQQATSPDSGSSSLRH